VTTTLTTGTPVDLGVATDWGEPGTWV